VSVLEDVSGDHLKAIEKYGGKRGSQAVALLAAYQVIAPLAKTIWDKVHKKEQYSITVSGMDDIYPDLHEWVLERIPQVERKALIAVTTESYGHEIRSSDENPPPLRLRYDGSRIQNIEIDSCKIWVQVSREEKANSSKNNTPDEWRMYTEKIVFMAETAQGRDAIVNMIDGLVRKKWEQDRPPPLLIPSRWGGSWNKRDDLPPRQLDSVILKQNQLSILLKDLESFLAAEKEYDRLSQPWHRGYLFYGQPGTGKTSVARALANYFDMPIHYLPLADLEKDADLMSLVGSIKPRSILLLEDVDVYHAATERSEDDSAVTISAMLNALDGVWTPHGLVTIMTTNRRETLDDALLRPGRVDVDMEFTLLDEEQAAKLYEWCRGKPCTNGFVEEYIGQSPAELIKALRDVTQKEKQHVNSN
jgi:hypothetical protein